MRASFPGHPFQGTRLLLGCALLHLLEVAENMKTERIHQSLKLLGFIYFYFLGTKTKLQELTTADSGTCQVPSGSFLTKLSLEGPWSISGRRRSCPPPCSVSSRSPPCCTAALPLLHHHHHSLCLHQDALSSSPWQ